MLFSTVFDYCNGLAIGHFRAKGREGGAKAVLIVSVVGNLAILGFFKYTDFAIDNLNGLLGTAIPALGLLLPIGISFYTFQTMSYTIDVYRGLVPPQRNIIDFGAYVTLFPQLIAGPIVQYKTVAYDLEHRRETLPQASEGLQRFVIGLGKKVLLANQMGAIWEDISAMSSPSVITAWLGALAFTFQIYFDFSGYSDMAIGLGRFFGFHFLENFNYPYESRTVTEFWRRWHISLSTWFREYVYIPLGGNRKGLGRQLVNITIVWFLTGLWHGASWNFVLWGVYYAACCAGWTERPGSWDTSTPVCASCWAGCCSPSPTSGSWARIWVICSPARCGTAPPLTCCGATGCCWRWPSSAAPACPRGCGKSGSRPCPPPCPTDCGRCGQ